jgi:alcohol dehydrogenase
MTASTYRSTLVDAADGPLHLGDVAVRDPGPGEVRVTVRACGICHSDSEFVTGHWPGTTFPVTPGHEVAGVVAAVGEGVTTWQPGERVAIGWSGGYCGACAPCRRGDFMYCAQGWVTGASFPGGYADELIAPHTALARIPDGLSDVDAAPLACAGVTMFNSLRRSSARLGDTVAVLGLGGLGHLGVQFAAKAGFRTVAIARGADKADLAHRLGAHHYIDSTTTDVADALQRLGGAHVVQATATNADAISATLGGLTTHGELITLGVVPDSLTVSPLQLITTAGVVRGHAGGTAADIEDTMNFAALHGITPMTETMPLTDVAAGYDRMMANQARFRVVLTP